MSYDSETLLKRTSWYLEKVCYNNGLLYSNWTILIHILTKLHCILYFESDHTLSCGKNTWPLQLVEINCCPIYNNVQ